MTQRMPPYYIAPNVVVFYPRLRIRTTSPCRPPYVIDGVDLAKVQRTADVIPLPSKPKSLGDHHE